MRTIRRVEDLKGFALSARDGELGKLTEVYFDDERWVVRYFVVHTGRWLLGRNVLIAPRAVRRVSEKDDTLEVDLSREQVEKCPPADTEVPVSRHYETLYYYHYGWEPYWVDPVEAVAPPLEPLLAVSAREELLAEPPNPHLRSSREVVGYRIHAKGGPVGHVEDLLLDDREWGVRYLEVDTRNWWPGKKVLIAPAWIEEVSWGDREVSVKVTREAIRGAPEYDPSERIGPDDEIRLLEYYGQSMRES
jgi:hypothetical protein